MFHENCDHDIDENELSEKHKRYEEHWSYNCIHAAILNAVIG